MSRKKSISDSHFQIHECHICGKVFYRNDVYRCHLRIHNNDKPFVCNICGKGFAHSGNRNQHAATHLQSLSFKCDLCEKAYTNKIYLNRHVKKIHPEYYVPSKQGQVHPERRASKSDFKQNIKTKSNSETMVTNNVKSELKSETEEKVCITQISLDSETLTTPHNNGRSQNMDITEWTNKAKCVPGIFSVPKSVQGVKMNIKGQNASSLGVHSLSEEKIYIQSVDMTNGSSCSLDTNNATEEKVYIPPTFTSSQKASTMTFKQFQGQGNVKSTDMQSCLVCQFCDKVFEQRHKYQLHIMMHELEQSKTCKVCNKKFPSLPEKKKHDLSHLSNRKSIDSIADNDTNNFTVSSQHNIPKLKGFSVEDLKVVGMIYTVTGADGHMNPSHNPLEPSESQNFTIVKTEAESE